MYDPNSDASPFNPLPPVVMALAGLVLLLEGAFQAGESGLFGGGAGDIWRGSAIQNFGFWTAYFDYLTQSGDWRLDGLYRFVTYAFVHQNFTHAIFATVMILALGNYTSKIFSGWALLVVFILASIVGAVVFGLTSTPQSVLFGAYPAVYGFLGIFTWSLWIMADRLGTNPLAAFKLVGVLLGIQLLFILYYGHWDSLFSEVAGFVLGFAIAPLLAPGGIARLKARLRDR